MGDKIWKANTDFLIIGNNDAINECLTFLPRSFPSSTMFHPIYGRHIFGLADACYQLSRSFPREYIINSTIHALYDLVLGFETEPSFRVIVWHDADFLLKQDRSAFIEIAGTLLTAALLNRLGIGTQKEDGSAFTVVQTCVFGINLIPNVEMDLQIVFEEIFQNMRINGPDDPLFIKNAIMQRQMQTIRIE